jgi:hypothetical protein
MTLQSSNFQNSPSNFPNSFSSSSSPGTEIIEYTDKDEVAVCNLASIALPMFVKEKVRGIYVEII